MLLDLLHELAHHKSWILAGKELTKIVIRALNKEEDEMSENDKKIIYQTEKYDSKYQYIIAHELGLKIPESKIKISVEQTNWIYKFNWKKNRQPTRKEKIINLNKLKEKYEKQ